MTAVITAETGQCSFIENYKGCSHQGTDVCDTL